VPGGQSESITTPERVRLADAVRHLIDAVLTADDATPEELDTAAAAAERIAASLHPRGELGDRPEGVRSRAEETHEDYLPRSPLVGRISPIAPPIEYEFHDGGVRAGGVFHAAFEGPPGYVHGGWIALAFDEILGMTNMASGNPGMTGRLSIRYRRPTPLHTKVAFRGWVEQVDGRRVVTRGTLSVDDVVTAEAEGLFVMLSPELALEYFGPEMAERRKQLEDPLP
jgi:acyl-coenzyme A thioesterase PaaI-like protein